MVEIIAGKDRGKKGKVLKAFPKKDSILVEGINVHKKHERPRKGGQKGKIVDHEWPIHISNARVEG